MALIQASLRLVTYGCGSAFRPELFKPVRNAERDRALIPKPIGGLWASPVGAKHGWRWFCKTQSFGNLTSQFYFKFAGAIYQIDSAEDATKLPWYQPIPELLFKAIDFEGMLATGADAIWLTDKGWYETRWTIEHSLYGWDCESVLILNPAGIRPARPTKGKGNHD